MLSSIYGSRPSGLSFMSSMLRKITSLLAVTTVVVGTAACGGEESRAPEDVPADAIALIGDTEVPRAEFDQLMERAEKSLKAQGRPFPKAGTPEYQDLKTRAVSFLVQRYRFREEAQELDIEVSNEDVDKELEKIRKESFGGSDKKLQEALKREGLTLEQAREELRDRLLQERLYERVTEDVEVTQEDIEAYYEKNKQQFSQPASRDVSHIILKTKAKADQVYAQLQGGANFATLAKQESTDKSTAKQGGKIPVTKGSTVPPFDKVAFELETGEVSKPVKTQFGWHIIKANADAKPEKATPLEKVEKSIQQQLETEKKNEALQKWLKSLEEKYEGETVFAAGFEPPKTDTSTTPSTTTAE
jgi:foldase protein PrsA